MNAPVTERLALDTPTEARRVGELTPMAPPRPSREVAAPRADATSLLVAITRAAADPNVDMDKMERLWKMHQAIVAQEAKAAFHDALARAQAKIVPVVKTGWNDHTKSWYVKLGKINEQIVPIYAAEGLSLSFDTETKNDADPVPQNHIRIVAIVSHSAGYERRHHIDLALDDAGTAGTKNKTKVQASGSTNSFGRRYLTLMIFNVSTEDDNDGNGARGNKNADGQQERKQAPQQKQPDTRPAYSDEAITANLDEWQQLVATGKKTADRIIDKLKTRYTLTDTQVKRINKAIGLDISKDATK